MVAKVAIGLAVPIVAAVAVVFVALFAATGLGAPIIVAPAAVAGIDPTLLIAYSQAATTAAKLRPGCAGMRWSVLAGIGMVESGHAAGHTVSGTGRVTPPIYGPLLDGTVPGTTRVPDTDRGHYDGNPTWDRAVGPLQFLPGTWAEQGRDGNSDRMADPHNVFDATLTTALYLCGESTVDLLDSGALASALRRYNDSAVYVAEVTGWIAAYDEMSIAALDPIPASGLGSRIVAAAMRWLGTPYSWGGGSATGPTTGVCCSPGGQDGRAVVGFDCSGLTLHAAAAAGIALPRVSSAQYLAGPGTRISRGAGIGALLPGDLVFFAFDIDNPATI
ncbi:MAG TPA: NlpC/P60 family protein, partial [Actinomycetes bacterium]|nr:NlpC/P60 family protein [Actinomycetes bacterium]